jgi:hypothetical protein
MSVTIVSEWRFKPRANIAKGLAAAAEYVDYLNKNNPEVQLSIWLAVREDPNRFLHVAVFDSHEAYLRERDSESSQRFAEQLSPEIGDQASFTQTECDVILSSGGMLHPMTLARKYRML